MLEIQQLKNQLGTSFSFQKHLSTEIVHKLLAEKTPLDYGILFATLEVGCVKIDAAFYPVPDGLMLGYDIFVKDVSDSIDWICYDSLTVDVNYNAENLEREMFSVLNAEVIRHELSYTECNFEKVRGKKIKKK